MWEVPTMTVVADAKKRVTLRTAKAGDTFDVEVTNEGKVILTKLVPAATKPIRLVKRHGYSVAIGPARITQEQVRKLMDEFP
jgi:phage FluMu protein gp41